MGKIMKLRAVEASDMAEPSPLTLEQAQQAARQADAALRQARADVADVLDRAPGGMVRDRRWFEAQAPLVPRSLDDPNLTEDARARLAHRAEFDAAVAAEERANLAVADARAAADRLQHQAELAALGDGRAKLAERQIALSEIDREFAAVEAALAKIDDEIYPTNRLIENLEEALAEAKNGGAAQHLIDEVLGKAVEAPKSLKLLRAELQDAQDTLETATAAREGLRNRLDSILMHRTFRRSEINDAVKHVVRADPGIRALLSAFTDARRTYLSQRSLITYLSSMDVLPDGTDVSERADERHETPDLAVWSAAIEALKTDHLGSLPEVPP